MPARARPAQPLPVVEKVAAERLLAQVKQAEEALGYLGDPLPPAARQAIAAAGDAGDEAKVGRAVCDMRVCPATLHRSGFARPGSTSLPTSMPVATSPFSGDGDAVQSVPIAPPATDPIAHSVAVFGCSNAARRESLRTYNGPRA